MKVVDYVFAPVVCPDIVAFSMTRSVPIMRLFNSCTQCSIIPKLHYMRSDICSLLEAAGVTYEVYEINLDVYGLLQLYKDWCDECV